MKRLLILGNGFDLQAGLDTTYNDFFIFSEKPLFDKWSKDTGSVDESQISLISLLLYNSYYRKTETLTDFRTLNHYQVNYRDEYIKTFGLDTSVENWMDVEGFLAKVLKGRGFNILNKCFEKNFSFWNDNNKGICEEDDIPLLIRKAGISKRYFHNPSFQEFIINELKIFEKRFADYIRHQLEVKIDYTKNTSKILNDIIPATADEISIINFNYTYIDGSVLCSNGDKKIINVHGTIDDNPIIGIDSGENLDETIIPFTKTFRKLVGQKESKALEKYDQIIIYGHSLGEQDYSYFHSIFDYVDLYRGNTKVIFFYSDNFVKANNETELNNKKINLRVKMAQSLFTLIKKYGETLDNKSNGKNLVHKLLLEGRLKIELKNFIDLEALENDKSEKNS